MGLPWVRLDTGFPMNPKVLSLVEDKKWQSIAVYVAGLAYSGQQGTDGFLPASSLVFMHGTKRNGMDLVNVGLWIPTPGGYEINDWTDYQQTSEENELRRKRAKDAAEIRWHGTPDPKRKGLNRNAG